MKKQAGFSALELMIVMAISTMIMTCLLTIYTQVAKNMNRVDRFVFEDMQLLALNNRMSKDLAGISAIWFTQEQIEEKKIAKQGGKAPEQEQKKSSNFFYSVNKDKNLDLLTFVTTSSLQSYNSMQERFVRVVYQLQVDPKHTGMFRLMRNEIAMPTESIDEQVLKKGAFYELVSGIASVEMAYQLIDSTALKKQQEKGASKESDHKKSETKQDAQPVIRSVKQWKDEKKKKDEKKDAADQEKNQDKEDLGGAAVPKFVTMNIVFGQTDQQQKKDYILEFSIPSNLENVPRSMLAIKKSQTTKPETKDIKAEPQETKISPDVQGAQPQ